MQKEIRQRFNEEYTQEHYTRLQDRISQEFNLTPVFRVAESPVFVSRNIKQKIWDACDEIMDVICTPDYKEKTLKAIPPGQFVPNEDEHTLFLQMDFGMCIDPETGEITPQLIEVQGFPSLYFFQYLVAKSYREIYTIPDNYTSLFNNFNWDTYLEYMKRVMLDGSDSAETILLEIDPENQVTRIDFLGCEKYLGIKTCCVTDLYKDGQKLYYLKENGDRQYIKKIFNRVIFDELLKRPDLERRFSFKDELDVEWIGHPNWFHRISKYTLPLLDSQYVPKTSFLNELDVIPEDLENYVLKPIHSFSGSGVEINVQRSMIDAIVAEDRENWILQKKVEYASVVDTPDGPAKCEIRMLMFWEKGEDRPVIVNNLARLSKGEMIGVRYNKDKTWVGGSVGFFEV